MKEVIEGCRLAHAQMDIARSVEPLLRFIASLGSVTDTLKYSSYCVYSNEFPFVVKDLDVDKLRTIAQEAVGLYGRGGLLWLEGFLGCEPRLVMSKVRLAANIRHFGEPAMP